MAIHAWDSWANEYCNIRAWVPSKPDHVRRAEKAQGRHALDHGFVLDSVASSLTGRDSPLIRKLSTLEGVG